MHVVICGEVSSYGLGSEICSLQIPAQIFMTHSTGKQHRERLFASHFGTWNGTWTPPFKFQKERRGKAASLF